MLFQAEYGIRDLTVTGVQTCALPIFVMHLDASALSAATYPLYVDPPWVLVANAQNGWPGTVDNVTSDWGDRNLRFGLLADNFNDNTNDIWTVVSGNSFSLSFFFFKQKTAYEIWL